MVQVQYGTENIPTATAIVLTPEGLEKTVVATGSGSVEAILIHWSNLYLELYMSLITV